MTTINNQDDFLRALEENPDWKAAVRAHILGEELLQLPVQFRAFVERVDRFMVEQERTNAKQERFNVEQRETNARFERRLDQLTRDVAQVKGGYARWSGSRYAAGIALDMGFGYVRTVPFEELAVMAHQSAGGDIPINELRSFRDADLVIEAREGDDTRYIAVEISFTADLRDTVRAQRNARFLEQFTGSPAVAAIAGVRKDNDLDEEINANAIHWHQITERDVEPG